MFGSQDLFVLLGIGIFFFGAKRLPELSRSLGQAMTEFRKGMVSGVPEAKTEAKAEGAKDEKSQAG